MYLKKFYSFRRGIFFQHSRQDTTQKQMCELIHLQKISMMVSSTADPNELVALHV